MNGSYENKLEDAYLMLSPATNIKCFNGRRQRRAKQSGLSFYIIRVELTLAFWFGAYLHLCVGGCSEGASLDVLENIFHSQPVRFCDRAEMATSDVDKKSLSHIKRKLLG